MPKLIDLPEWRELKSHHQSIRSKHLRLAAAVFSQNFSLAHRVANTLQAGIVWINEYNITPAEIPFGGYKESGIGRENGLQTIEHFTQTKTIYANLGKVEKTY